jgi:transposase InsO family protein
MPAASSAGVSRMALAGFVLVALEQALHERRPVPRGGLIHHGDRGVQYVSIRYTERLAAATAMQVDKSREDDPPPGRVSRLKCSDPAGLDR